MRTNLRARVDSIWVNMRKINRYSGGVGDDEKQLSWSSCYEKERERQWCVADQSPLCSGRV